MSTKHNKRRVTSLNLLMNCMLVTSAPQILPGKDECTFHFSNFLIIGLCNPSANSWFDIFSIFILPPPFFYQEFVNH